MRKANLGQNIIDKVLSQIENTWRRATNPGFRMELGWVKGHSGVEGNEKVDLEAKEAARGRSSQARSLPIYLTKEDLPRSVAAQKQVYDATLLDRWRKEWTASP